MRRKLCFAITTLLVLCLICPAAILHGAAISWIGGNSSWDASTAKWSPADEPDFNDDVTINTGNSVTLANASELVLSLALSGGTDLATNNNDLTVDGLLQVGGVGTTLSVGDVNTVVAVDSANINADGSVLLKGGTLAVNDETAVGVLNINSNGRLAGQGTITLSESLVGAADLLNLSGTLAADSLGSVLVSPPGKLTINVTNPLGRVDLSAAATAVVTAARNQTLEINATLAGPFTTAMNLLQNSTVDIRDPWAIAGTGTVTVDNGATLFPASGATVSHLAGGIITQAGGTITVTDNDGTLQFDAPFNQSSGSLVNNGTVVFNANATFASGGTFTLPTDNSSLTVNPGVNVTITQPGFQLDGNGTATNHVRIENDALLDITLGPGFTPVYDNIIDVTGGILDVFHPNHAWQLDGTVRLTNTAKSATLRGEPVSIGNDSGTLDASLIVSGGGVALIDTGCNIASDANIQIDANTTLRITGNTVITAVNGSNSADITGAGTLQLDGTNNSIGERLIINMPDGRVDLDGTGAGPNQILSINSGVNLTLNVKAIDSSGNKYGNGGGDSIVLFSGGKLNINLTDPLAGWTLSAGATLHVHAIPDSVQGNGGLLGSDVTIAGTANIDGQSAWSARTNLTGTINIAANSSLRFAGGSLLAPNTIQGGTINGPGELRMAAGSGQALTGFGTIHVPLSFTGNAGLTAEGGTLTLTAPLFSIGGVINVNGPSGVLSVSNPWNTNQASQLVMNGGTVQGAAITNDALNGITGFGLISASILNNSDIHAANGQALTLSNPTSDWDGSGNAGRLFVDSQSTLRLQDNLPFDYHSSIVVAPNGVLDLQGFDLHLVSASKMELREATAQTNSGLQLGGTFLVSGAVDSTLQSLGTTQFVGGSHTQLNANLRLDNNVTSIASGAEFAGTHELINQPNRTLRLEAGANVNVAIENQGTLAMLGDATALGLQLTSTSLYSLRVTGAQPDGVSTLNLLSPSHLEGELVITRGAPYIPALGDTFTLMTGPNITGTFSNPINSFGQGLALKIIYNPTSVVAQVVTAPSPCDLNGDGAIDAADAGIMFGNWGASGVGDITQDDIVDAADAGEMFAKWTGDTSPWAVPEPTFWLGTVLALTQTRRISVRQVMPRDN